MRSPPCAAHPAAPAAWRCSACERDLCDACAASVPAGRGELAVCAACGGLVELLTGARAEVRPFSETWTAALRPVFSARALALVAVFSFAVEFLLGLGPRSWLLGQALELGWILIVVRRAGREYPPFGVPHWDDLTTAFTGALPRLLASAGFLGACAAALVGLGLQASPSTLAAWLIAALAVPLVPPAVLFACIEGYGARWLAPWNLPRAARTIGRDLWPARIITAFWAALLAVKATQPPLELEDTHMGEKIFAGAALHFLALAALAAFACVVGHLLLTRGEELAHGEPESWRVFLFPAAVPSGQRARPAPKPVEQPAAAPIAREALLAALAAGNSDEAMVILARLCDGRLGDASEAQALYLAVVERFPGTPAARFAQSRLAP